MLVLTRKPKQQIMIGDDVVINIVEVQGDNVRIAIDAPRSIKIFRGEIYKAIQEENKMAAAPTNVDLRVCCRISKKQASGRGFPDSWDHKGYMDPSEV